MSIATSWTNGFLWQELGKLKQKVIKAMEEINNIDINDDLTKEKLESVSKNMSKQFNKIKEQINNLEILDETLLEGIQNQISKIALKNNVSKIATLE